MASSIGLNFSDSSVQSASSYTPSSNNCQKASDKGFMELIFRALNPDYPAEKQVPLQKLNLYDDDEPSIDASINKDSNSSKLSSINMIGNDTKMSFISKSLKDKTGMADRISGAAIWDIPDYSKLNEYCVKSRTFILGGYSWMLRLFPFGSDTKSKSDSVAVFLFAKERVTVDYTLTLETISSEVDFVKPKIFKSRFKEFTSPQKGHGCPNFFSRRLVIAENGQWKGIDVISIKVEIFFGKTISK